MHFWAKALHIIFMVTWFSGLFYLPRLFVYHAMSTDQISIARFKIMERKLFYGITTPSAILTIFFGLWMVSMNASVYLHMIWFHIKMGLVILLVLYHIYLGYLVHVFRKDQNVHSHLFYRFINELPVILLAAIVIMVCVKPFQVTKPIHSLSTTVI